MFAYAWKEITRRKARSTLTIAGIFFSILLLVAALAIMQFFRDAMMIPFKTAGTDLAVTAFVEPGPFKKVRQARHLGALPDNLLPQISQIPGVKGVSGVLLFWDYHPEDKNPMYNCCGVDVANPSIGPLSLAPVAGQRYAVIDGRSFSLDDKYTAIVDKRFAQAKNLKIGDHIELGYKDFEIVGLADMRGVPRVAEAEIYIPLSTAKELVHENQPNFPKDAVNMILVKLDNPKMADEVKPKIMKLVAQATGLKPKEQIKIMTAEAILPDTTGVSTVAQKMIKVLSILVVIGVAILVMRTAVASIGERTREIGIMKALGWRNGDISKLMMMEMAVQTTIGGILGIIVGYILAYIYASTAVFQLPHNLIPASCAPAAAPPENLKVAMQVYPWILITALLVSIVVGVLSGYLASRKAAALEPAQAIRAI
jgi:ABC-type antimicrobial peptide transport system permease subunit